MNEPLAQCPYCFARAPQLSNNLFSFQVTCTTCFATGPWKATRKEAIVAWSILSHEVQEARLKLSIELHGRLGEVENAVLLHR